MPLVRCPQNSSKPSDVLTSILGVLVDIWDPARRGHAVAFFAACVFLGPVCGPIVGGL